MERGKFFQSNHRTRIYLDAIAEVIGHHGLLALLRLADLTYWIDHPPPYDEVWGVDFADFSQLNATLEMMYGPRGQRALTMRAGRASFDEAIEQLGPKVGLAGATFQALPVPLRIKALLEALARGMEQHGHTAVTVRKEGAQFIYSVHTCSMCWGQHDVEHPVCHGTVGFLLQALTWAEVGDDFQVEESRCSATQAAGDGRCEFTVSAIA